MPPQRVRKGQQIKIFDDYVRKAIDSGLAIIGETGKGFVYYYMESQHSIPVADMPKRIEAFHNALQGTFGYGSKIIEKFIAINLYGELSLGFTEHKDWTLMNYVDNAKKVLEEPE